MNQNIVVKTIYSTGFIDEFLSTARLTVNLRDAINRAFDEEGADPIGAISFLFQPLGVEDHVAFDFLVTIEVPAGLLKPDANGFEDKIRKALGHGPMFQIGTRVVVRVIETSLAITLFAGD